jgi:hypothetical protein
MQRLFAFAQNDNHEVIVKKREALATSRRTTAVKLARLTGEDARRSIVILLPSYARLCPDEGVRAYVNQCFMRL